LSPVKELSLKMLTYKTVALLVILSAQRCQTLHFLDIRNMVLTDKIVKFSIGDKLKQTKPGKHVHMNWSFLYTQQILVFVLLLLLKNT